VYGIRLRELFTGGMTWRELGVYVRAMPVDSATRTALNDGRPEPTGEQVLLADVFDVLQNVDWHIVASNASKKSELPKRPRPYPRWWDAGPRKPQHSPQRVARIEDARRRAAARREAIEAGRIA
jgi:hypothetical protein